MKGEENLNLYVNEGAQLEALSLWNTLLIRTTLLCGKLGIAPLGLL